MGEFSSAHFSSQYQFETAFVLQLGFLRGTKTVSGQLLMWPQPFSVSQLHFFKRSTSLSLPLSFAPSLCLFSLSGISLKENKGNCGTKCI